MVHGSEVAHWEDPDFLIGLLNAVPKRPETIVVLESTANGFNHFYDRWQRAVAGAEDPETGGLYVPLFYGWQDNPFNASVRERSGAGAVRSRRSVTRPAAAMTRSRGWSSVRRDAEQLYWRRVTIMDECDGRLEIFHQEHPATPEQAFIGSGNPVFSQLLVSRAITAAQASQEPVEGVLRGDDYRERHTRRGTVRVPQKALWLPEPAMTDADLWARSRLAVWEHPVNAATEAGKPGHERRLTAST
jgi:hypothetical protein